MQSLFSNVGSVGFTLNKAAWTGLPDWPFQSLFESQHQEISERHVVQERGVTEFEAPKVGRGKGHSLNRCTRY